MKSTLLELAWLRSFAVKVVASFIQPANQPAIHPFSFSLGFILINTLLN